MDGSATDDNAGQLSVPARSPQWWLRMWPQIRRVMACVDKHSSLWPWPQACNAVLQTSGLPSNSPVPAVMHWDTLAKKVPVGDKFPDMVLVTPRATCDCGRVLTEQKYTWQVDESVGRCNVRMLTKDGLKLGVNYAVHCKFCQMVYYSYYKQRRPPGIRHAHKSEPWLFDDHRLATPAAVMVNATTAVSWDFLHELNTRMVRNPFSWRQLGREYWQNHLCGTNDAKVFNSKQIACCLFHAWQWFIVFEWRLACRSSDLELPVLETVREPDKKMGSMQLVDRQKATERYDDKR